MPRNKTVEFSIFFVSSFLEAIDHLVQKALLTCEEKQKITVVALQNFFKRENGETIAPQTSPKNKDFVWTG